MYNNFMTNKFKQGKYLYVVLSILLLISIVPLVYISFYSRPSADDFNYSVTLYRYLSGGNYNIFGLIKKAIEVDINFYNNWQGLYSSAFILALQPGIFGEKYYCIGAILLLIISFLCIFYLIKTIFKILKLDKYYLFLSIFVFVFLFQQLPDIKEGLYWFNGAWNYMPFFFLSLLNVGLCLRYLFVEEKKKYLVFSCVLSFVISGGNHVTSFMNILLLMVVSICAPYKKKKLTCLSLVVAIMGFILMYCAPGTAVRQARFSNPSILNTIKQTFIRSFTFTSQYTSRNGVFYILAIVLFSIFIYQREYFKDYYFKHSPFIYLFIAWVILCGMLAVPYYAMGSFGEGRVVDVIWLFETTSLTLITIYTTWYLLYRYFEVRDIRNDMFVNFLFVGLVLISAYWVTCNYMEAIKELTNGEALAFSCAYDERVDKIKNNYDDVLYINSLPESNLLKHSDLSSDGGWINGSFMDYYNISEAFLVKTTWIKKDQLDSYLNDLKNVGLMVLSKDSIYVYDKDNKGEFTYALNTIFDTTLGKLEIVTKDDEYQIMLDDTCIKEGNIKELSMFDYLVLLPSESRFIKVF